MVKLKDMCYIFFSLCIWIEAKILKIDSTNLCGDRIVHLASIWSSAYLCVGVFLLWMLWELKLFVSLCVFFFFLHVCVTLRALIFLYIIDAICVDGLFIRWPCFDRLNKMIFLPFSLLLIKNPTFEGKIVGSTHNRKNITFWSQC